MTDKQPEALSIAKRLKDQQQPLSLALRHKAAAELRRLHEVNAEVVEALKRILYDANNIGSAHIIAGDALVKATGEQQ